MREHYNNPRASRALKWVVPRSKSVCGHIIFCAPPKWKSWIRPCNISSIESQKGATSTQRCSIENQKGAFAIAISNSDSALLVLNGTSLNIDRALLALNWWCNPLCRCPRRGLSIRIGGGGGGGEQGYTTNHPLPQMIKPLSLWGCVYASKCTLSYIWYMYTVSYK